MSARRWRTPQQVKRRREEIKAQSPGLIAMSDFVAGALRAGEVAAVLRAAVAGDDAAAQFYAVLTAHGHVTLGDDLAEPERQRTEAMLDQAVAAGWLARERKAEILAWRPAP